MVSRALEELEAWKNVEHWPTVSECALNRVAISTVKRTLW